MQLYGMKLSFLVLCRLFTTPQSPRVSPLACPSSAERTTTCVRSVSTVRTEARSLSAAGAQPATTSWPSWRMMLTRYIDSYECDYERVDGSQLLWHMHAHLCQLPKKRGRLSQEGRISTPSSSFCRTCPSMLVPGTPRETSSSSSTTPDPCRPPCIVILWAESINRYNADNTLHFQIPTGIYNDIYWSPHSRYVALTVCFRRGIDRSRASETSREISTSMIFTRRRC